MRPRPIYTRIIGGVIHDRNCPVDELLYSGRAVVIENLFCGNQTYLSVMHCDFARGFLRFSPHSSH
jgi:hypothetical protein